MVAVVDASIPTFGEPLVSTFVFADPGAINLVTQGSFDPTGNGRFKHAKQGELDWWRERIEKQVRWHRGPGAPTVTTPVVASLLFVAPRRASHAKYRIWPMGTEGDVDKLARAAFDGLARNIRHHTVGRGDRKRKIPYTVGAEVVDDDRKVMAAVAMKTYAQSGEEPGLQVRVWAPDPDLERYGWVPVPDWPGWRYVHRDQLLCV